METKDRDGYSAAEKVTDTGVMVADRYRNRDQLRSERSYRVWALGSG